MELYRKNEDNEHKDRQLKALLKENELLNEKLIAVESDLKVILNNRQKIENLEDIICRFVSEDKQKPQTDACKNTSSTKFMSKDQFGMIKLIIESQDMTKSIPKWYISLQSKNKFT
jgi:hypothetical protein